MRGETNGVGSGLDSLGPKTQTKASNDEIYGLLESAAEWSLPMVDAEARGEAGSVDVEMLPLTHAIELKQIRQSYDADKLQELADRMPVEIVDGEPRITLVNPPTLNIMDREHLEVYVTDMQAYHRGEIEPVDIDSLPSHDGLYYVVVNGHRRRRALYLKCSQLGIKPENLATSFTVKHNLSFEEAKPQQYVENTSEAINPVEDAAAIELHYLWLRDRGQDCSVTALQKVFGYSSDKIRDALRFVMAPDRVREFVGRGLTYSNVVDLVRLREAYAMNLKCQAIRENDLDNLEAVTAESERRMVDYFETRILSRLQSKPSKHIAESIKRKITEVKESAAFSNESLFEFDEELERRRRRTQVRRDMGAAAIETLRYLDDVDALTDAQRAELTQLLGLSRAEENARIVTETELTDSLFN